MISRNRSFGDRGEALVCDYLKKKGYRIREKQWRSKVGEIDVIAEKGGVFVFVEVKTRQSNAFGYPEEAVTERKRQHLMRAAELYCQLKNIEKPRRIDVVAVIIGGNDLPLFEHFEDITGTS
ncbi:MAG: YraN family protein [bacterium]|nr:YraN family protein [bacterium]